MAYDSGLEARIEECIADMTGVSTRKMFGGLCFMLNGNMACGIIGSELMVRVGPEKYQLALMNPAAREMDFTGKPLKGMVYISESGVESDDDLQYWLQQGINFAASLPAK